MVTLDEAIKHAEEKAAELREYSDVLSETSTTPKGKEISDCLECAEEHEQLAEWLKDYKRLLEMPKGDLISREALKEEVRKHVTGNNLDVFVAKNIMCLIDNAPTVEQEVYIHGEDYDFFIRGYKEGRKDFERPQGKWILPNIYEDGVSYECSNCHIPHEGYIGEEGKPHGYDFCPNCGADMRGKEE